MSRPLLIAVLIGLAGACPAFAAPLFPPVPYRVRDGVPAYASDNGIPGTADYAYITSWPTLREALNTYGGVFRRKDCVAAEAVGVTTQAQIATFTIHVPAHASLQVAGWESAQRGEIRTYHSPPLLPGPVYVYPVTASWDEGGVTIRQQRNIRFHAGDTIMVDFTAEQVAPFPRIVPVP